MKHIILSLFALVLMGESMAQTTYESSHVKDGKTIQFTIPKGFFCVENSDEVGDAMFTTRDGLNYVEMDSEELNLGFLSIMHERADEEVTLQMMQNELADEIGELDGVMYIEEPTITELNGREFVRGGFKGEIEGDKLEGMYLSMTRFGDYSIFISYYATGGVTDILTYESFKKLLETWKEVPTSKEDKMAEYDMDLGDLFDDDEMEDLEMYYQNDLFETELTYYDILPDFGQNWDEPADESGHLLSMFTYNEDNGSIKIFSGGKASNYPTDKEKADAIQRATDYSSPISLTPDSGFSNEDHVFKLYSISGGGTMSSVYTSVVNEELLFFIIDGGNNPLPDFKPAVRDLMLTMWIDYFDEELLED